MECRNDPRYLGAAGDPVEGARGGALCHIDSKTPQSSGFLPPVFLAEFSIRIEPVTAEQALLARQAFVLFGKGRHKAGLNFGDCFTYALARATREPVLFKGGDFGHTDLEAA